jgi:hypothetical protein
MRCTMFSMYLNGLVVYVIGKHVWSMQGRRLLAGLGAIKGGWSKKVSRLPHPLIFINVINLLQTCKLVAFRGIQGKVFSSTKIRRPSPYTAASKHHFATSFCILSAISFLEIVLVLS